uniref:RxLR effector protein n=1 Tax=Phytophthora sojae TaxID=67593 RepID=G1FSC4_PHYSO|nr:Avh242 [Phytophthora sojae]
MRTSLLLAFATAALLANLGVVSCSSEFIQTEHVQPISDQSIGHRHLRYTKSTSTAEAEAADEERGIKITDLVILENLAKFDDWVGEGKTAEKLYKELGLKLSWKIAYQTSRWKQFLFDEPEYLLFRKYVKYLKLIGREDP